MRPGWKPSAAPPDLMEVVREIRRGAGPRPVSKSLGRDTTTIQLRALLQTSQAVDPAMVPRILGAMSGVWSSKNRPVTDWLNAVSASGTVKPDVISAVRKLMGMEE